jgi:hypothetical protein
VTDIPAREIAKEPLDEPLAVPAADAEREVSGIRPIASDADAAIPPFIREKLAAFYRKEQIAGVSYMSASGRSGWFEIVARILRTSRSSQEDPVERRRYPSSWQGRRIFLPGE